MKKMSKLILASISVAIITASCSIEKRVHNSGYHISWNKVKHQSDDAQNTVVTAPVKEKTNKSFTNVESIAKSDELKENATQANLSEVRNLAQIENKLVESTSLTRQKSSQIVAQNANSFGNQVSKSVNNSDSKTKMIKAAKKFDKVAKSNAAKGGDNELLILLVLWFFLGMFAGHRWYAGKPVGWNILFILTAGGCGIWAIIDLIHIITGDF